MTTTATTPSPDSPAEPTAAPPRIRVVLGDLDHRPPGRVVHQPLVYRWPPLLCRIGVHRWRRREVFRRRPAGEVSGRPGRELCSRTSTCGRCDIVRHEQNIAVPAGWAGR